MKKVLIISFVFPPQYGIGGRRWAKFAKLLHEKGYDIQVICSNRFSEKESAWTEDTILYQDKIHEVDFKYPKVLTGNVNSLLDKINYRYQLWLNKKKIKGNFYDRTARESTQFIELVREFLSQGYNNVIISAGPFNYLSQVIKLKKEFPKCNFIADFRDPWTNNEMAFGFSELSDDRLSEEKRKEVEVINAFDFVLSVSDEMNDYFKGLTNNLEKFVTVPNGFDPEDRVIKTSPVQSEKLKFVLTGTFYKKAKHVFVEFLTALNEARSKYPELIQAKFDFYGDVDGEIKELSKNIDGVNFNEGIPMNEAHLKISGAHAGMLFLTDDLTYSFSTKFYEYLLYNKKVMVFSKKGKTGEYVLGKGIGYAFFLGDMSAGFDALMADYHNNKLIFPENFELSSESIQNRILNVEKILK